MALSFLAENEFLPEYKNNEIQTDNNFPFAIDKPENARREIIKVIAVGGGGGNAINHVIGKGIEGVELLAVNTDARSLEMSLCKETIILGEKSTKGLGAGAVPEIGEMAARESLAEVRAFLKGSDMVYFTAGMGGGTGTGALPVIAEAAREMGILSVAVVTKPFLFEGARKQRYAESGIRKLQECVDALIVVPNDRLLEISRKDMPLTESFSLADEVLRQAVLGVTNLITRPGLVNVDFADLKTVMKSAGRAVMGVGGAEGENRISKALKDAVESPLMECSMNGAKGVLMNITCGGDLGLYEVSEAASYVEKLLSDDATFIWGCVEDSELEGKVEIVIVATGFEEQARQEMPLPGFRTYKPPQYTRSGTQSRRQETLAQFDRYDWADAQEEKKEAAPPVYGEQSAEIAEIQGEELRSETIIYKPIEEKPRLISEMTAASDSSWILAGSREIKTDTDAFDSPTFSRQGRLLREPGSQL